MAPNRKSVLALAESLSCNDLLSLQNTIQPKFLPLTHPSEQQSQQSHTEAKVQASESQSYWDWSVPVEEEEKKVIDLFSVANIESNLIQAAAASKSVEETKEVFAHDDYWAEQATVEKPLTSQPQHILDNYWQWAADQDSKQATISNILAEDRAVHVVSGASTQARLVTGPKIVDSHVHATQASNDSYWGWTSPVVASHVNDSCHPSANYWDWDADANTKATAVQSILEEEKIRQLLMVGTIVSQIQIHEAKSSGTMSRQNDEYWTWSEDLGDSYWNEAPALVSTGQGYWDF